MTTPESQPLSRLPNGGTTYPNGGPVDDWEPPYVSISSPPNDSPHPLGSTIVVSGTAGDNEAVSAVRYWVDGNYGGTARRDSLGWARWSASITLPNLGTHVIAVEAGDTSGNTSGDSIQVQVIDVSPPTVSVISPVTGSPATTLSFKLQVRAEDPESGVQAVWCTNPGTSEFVQMDYNAETKTGEKWLLVPSPNVPAGGRSYPVTIRARNAYGYDSTLEAMVPVVDASPPTFDFSPAHEAQIPGTENGADVSVVVRASDSSAGMLNSGVALVQVRVDDGPYQEASLTQGSVPPTWTRTVHVPVRDEHKIWVRCVDGQGNAAEDSHTVLVTLPADVRDLSRQTYLADLIDFATRRLLTHTGGANITRGHLTEAFGQLFAATSQGSPEAATRPVHALRLATEAVRAYLGPRPKAPLAWWPLDDGSGTTARDAAGSYCDGTIVNGSWGAGRAGSFALAFNGTSTYVRVPPLPQLKMRDALTVGAWLRPTSSAPGTIVVREGEYLFGRSAAGTLRWAIGLAGQTTWEWVDTGVVVPPNVWSHATLTFDGAAVRTYVNGDLRHEVPRPGEIGDVAPADNEVRLGARPSGADYLQGQLSEVVLYDRALSHHDIKALLGQLKRDSEVWVQDDLPPGAIPFPGGEPWEWITSGPAPISGARCHRSALASGVHQHGFEGASLFVNRGDSLYCYVYLDPANPPRQVMLQWQTSTGWDHRAYWGQNLIEWGTNGTSSRRYLGALPAAGRWVRLIVPADLVGLDNTKVQGIAFTLYDGRASWDAAGRTGWRPAVRDARSAASAYRALLNALGTSYDELRLARAATPAVRRGLADRIGIPLSATRPDELDQMLLQLTVVTEADLERLFGVPSSERDPFGAWPTAPLLRTWRQARLRDRWRTEDLGVPGVGDYSMPVVDPDLLKAADFLDLQSTAYKIWQARTSWVNQQTTQLRAKINLATPAPAVTSLFTQVLPGVDLMALREQRRQGQDIEPTVLAAQLTMPAFNRLLELRSLADVGPLLAVEWDDLIAILVQVLKVRAYPGWRQEERVKGVLVEPDVFTIPPPEQPIALVPWRADWAVRQAWQQRLRTRRDQLADLSTALDAAVSAAEEAGLPVLRDALVAAAGRSDPGVDLGDSLTSRLLIDVKVGARVKTTRVDQAIETLQGVLFAARTSALDTSYAGLVQSDAAPWALDIRAQYTEAQFDQEWAWMGSYATWRAAISVFLHPEDLLWPTLRPASSCTKAFNALRQGVPTNGLTPKEARDFADGYLASLRSETTLPPEMNAFVLKEQLTEGELTERATLVRNLLGNVSSFGDIPVWAREVFYHVPMLLALALQSSEQYLAALAWMRSVYAYDRGRDETAAAPKPPNTTAFIFYGFRLDATGPAQLQRPVEWLLYDLNPHQVATSRANVHLKFTLLSIARCLLAYADSEFTQDSVESRPRARSLYLTARDVLTAPELVAPVPGTSPPNPGLDLLRGHADLNLRKLRLGLNIAGMSRSSVPMAEASGFSSPPTPYYYQTLVTRAQQLLAGASQVEASYLAALEKADAEAYNLFKASQDLDLARTRVRLQLTSAAIVGKELHLAELQRDRAAIQQRTYAGWIAAGANGYERAMLRNYKEAARYRDQMAQVDFAMTTVQAVSSAVSGFNVTNPGSWFGGVSAVATTLLAGERASLSESLNRAELNAQVNAFQASQERRENEWRLQRELAGADFAIGQQQVEIVAARTEVALQEVEVAETQQSHAEATVNFLAGKFTNLDLYRWMTDVLAGVYRYLLQQATSVARLAERQLAFERQEAPASYIKADYWAAPSRGDGQGQPDRRGLTGSARLLQDLTALDQYAFETNRRKLQLSHTVSLARTAPVEFQQFRETGVLPFATPMEVFDRSFPGHYLRLVRSVKVSVVGLIPPVGGIRATLTSGGVSNVVVGGVGGFTTMTLARPPEVVALTAPTNATGLFELDVQPELMRPFEGNGVDCTWEFQMPRPANPFDFGSVADVLVTLEYTALHSPDYAAQVMRELPQRVSNSLSFSARRDYPDGWYLLVAAGGEPPPTTPGPRLSIDLPISRRDFPPNVDRLTVDQVTLLLVRGDDVVDEISVDRLSIVRSTGRLDGGPAASVGGVISTRGGSGAAWLPLVGADPIGTWQLVLTDIPAMRTALQNGDIQDLVLLVSYGADLPAWPGTASASPTWTPTPDVPAAPPKIVTVPSTAGAARPGQGLAATTGTWSDPSSTYRYQWRRCDAAGANPVNIAGARAPTYTVVAADVGRTLRVLVTAVNRAGSANATSAPTPVVAAAPPTNTAAPTISGSARSGQVLTASAGTWQLAGAAYRYQWRRCDATGAKAVDIPGATAATYIVDSADVGSTLRVVVKATNAAGSTSATSVQTAVVTAGPPVKVEAPTITGTARTGEVLKASTGTWRLAGPTFRYQWRRCDSAGANPVNIAGATAATYTVVAADEGATLRVLVTATNAVGSTAATSAPTAIVAPA